MLYVENIRGNKNNYAIKDGERKEITFQSYQTSICKLKDEKIVEISIEWGCSNTTSKHLKWFIEDYSKDLYRSKKDFEKFINENFIYNNETKTYIKKSKNPLDNF